jgi:hypothetical protein
MSFIALFVMIGLGLRYSPVYADDGTQPPSDSSAVVETAPEGSDSGSSGGETGSTSPSVNPPAEPPAIEAVKIVSSPDKPAEADPTQEPAAPDEATQEPVVAESPTQTTNVTATPVPAVEQPAEATSTPTVKVTPTQQVFNVNEKLEKVIKPVDESLLAPESKSPETTPNLVVIDGNGTVLPLGSEQANETIALADPYFYVGATKFTFTTSNCGADRSNAPCSDPLQAAFDYIANHNISPVGGAVYAEAATYSSLSINGSSWANPLYVPISLSLIGVTDVDKQVGSSTNHIISGTLSVQNIKSFTLQAFSVNGSVSGNLVTFDNNTGTLNFSDVNVKNTDSNGWGLVVNLNNGPVNLNSVVSSGNGKTGTYINNYSTVAQPVSVINSNFGSNSSNGLVINSKSAVTIKNSAMNENLGPGLTVTTDGAVTLNGVASNKNVGTNTITSRDVTITQSIFNDNTSAGLELDASTVYSGNVIIQNSQFIHNGAFGAVINKHGNVSLTSIRAAENGMNGFWVDTRSDNIFTGDVTVTGSDFSNNMTINAGTGGFPYAGLGIQAKGTITLTNSNIESNGDATHLSNGAYLANLTGISPVNVTNSYFGHNSRIGLIVDSYGVITIKDGNATSNLLDGMELVNNYTGKIAGINVLNSLNKNNYFNFNSGKGLRILSNGPVVVNAAIAVNNGSDGILIDNSSGTGSVTIDGVTGTWASNNVGSGIYVVSKGMITVKNMDTSNNHEYGYFLNNQAGANTGVSVLVTIPRWHNGLDGNWINGLNILSKGAVIVQKIRANNNGYYGANINNSYGLGTVTISDSEFINNSNNSDTPLMEYGLFIQSKGAIMITNSRANDNGIDDLVNDANDVEGGGAWLDNSLATIPAAITITKGTFDMNFGNGLMVLSKGAVTYTTGSANNNYLTAVNVDNHLSTINQAVSLTSIGMYSNNRYGQTGLIVSSKGTITLLKTEANGFNGEAVNLDNHYGTGAIMITGEPLWWRYFGNNGGNGFTINTTGGVTMNYLSTNDNGGYGIQINTTGNLSTVQLSNMDVINNTLYGIDVNAFSNITLDNVRVTDNKSYGINLDNSSGTGTVTVRATNGQEIRNNTGYGLWVISKGSITLTNIEIHDNGSFGAWLDNHTGTISTVTINSTMYRNWSRNGDYGLQIDSPGAVIVTLVDAYDSGTYGADIDNTYAGGTLMPAVTITHSWFNNNHGGYESIIHDGYGLNVDSKGNISLTDVDANNNNDYGADLNNLLGTGIVTMTGPSNDDRNEFTNNADYGLNIQTRGAVTLKYLRTNDNAFYGTNINNSTSTLPQTVSLSTVDLNNNSKSINDGFGLTILSKGAITLFEVFTGDNGEWGPTAVTGNGMHLDNCILVGGKCTGSGTVSLTSSNAWGNNGFGMDIQSYGQITLSDISAGYNGLYGGKFNNAFVKANTNPLLADIKSTAGVTLSLPAGYSTAWGNFQNNGQYAFAITSNGLVNVSNVNVDNNGSTLDYAALIDNSTAATPMAVTVTNSTFTNNLAVSGIKVLSKGAITFTNNTVNSNHNGAVSGTGAAMLDNHTSTLPQNVTVTGSNFYDNGSASGLMVLTKGIVQLTDVRAGLNGADGINIDASYGKGTVTISGTYNVADRNSGNGIAIKANGKVSVSAIEAEFNTSGSGLSINTFDYGTDGTGTVTLSNVVTGHNGLNGILAKANGTIAMTNVISTVNGNLFNNDGANLITNNKDISITNCTFTSNVGRGITSDTGIGKTLKLVNTMYLGNDTNKSGDTNLSYTGLISIL